MTNATTTGTLSYRICEKYVKLLPDESTIELSQIIETLQAAGIECIASAPAQRRSANKIETPDGCTTIVPHEGASAGRAHNLKQYNGAYYREQEDGCLTMYSFGTPIVTLDARLRMRTAHIKYKRADEYDNKYFSSTTCSSLLSLYIQLDPDFYSDWTVTRVREDYLNCLRKQGDKPKPCTYEDYSAD